MRNIKVAAVMNVKPKLLDPVRAKIRIKHDSIRTEQAYVDWIRRYILFHGKRHPPKMGKPAVEQFLSHLAVERNVAASTQHQALSAILLLYKEVLEKGIGWLVNMERAKRPTRLPVVLTAAEVRAVLAHLEGRPRLMANLLSSAGLRLMACVRLRVKDLGAQFTSHGFIIALKAHPPRIGMDGRGRAVDNIFVERLWRAVKYEDISLKEYETLAQVQVSLKVYFNFYNGERGHQSLGYQTPDRVYATGQGGGAKIIDKFGRPSEPALASRPDGEFTHQGTE